jgi:hypothetical protein
MLTTIETGVLFTEVPPTVPRAVKVRVTEGGKFGGSGATYVADEVVDVVV